MSSDRLDAFAKRIEDVIILAGGVAPLSRSAGVSRGSIDNWRKGSADPSLSNIFALAEAVGASPEWLFSGEGPKFSADKRAEASVIQTDAYFSVPRYNAAASAGHGSFIQYAEVLDYIPFTEEFLIKRLGRSNADGLILVDARGDSMEPTINDNDLIMIDRNQSSNITAAIYAFTYEDGFFVKRINRLPDAYEVRSDNEGRYPSFTIEREQMNRIEILGRVVWIGHTP